MSKKNFDNLRENHFRKNPNLFDYATCYYSFVKNFFSVCKLRTLSDNYNAQLFAKKHNGFFYSFNNNESLGNFCVIHSKPLIVNGFSLN